MVRELSSHLVDIHGQHEQQSLLQRNVQRALLDEFGGAELIAVREEFADYWRRREQCRSELRQLAGNEQERARQLDLLKFQYEEIEQARLYPQEEEDLLTEARILANAEELANAVAAAYEFVYGGEQAAAGLTGLALQRLVTGVAIDPTLSRLEKDLQGALTQLEEVGRELRTYWETVAVDPERLAAVEQRLETIRRLKRKYGNDVTEILAFAARARQEAERLASSAETAQALQTELSGIEKALADSGCRLRMLRKQAARDLEKLVDRELAELGMGEARFQVVIQGELDPDGIDIGEGPQKGSWHGLDNSEFLLSANPGEPPKQLARVASGGELSRVMLALKTVLTGSGGVSTLIFDEIDAGIGGRTATAVGERLARLAAERQVLCVTHLAQIAACADRQYLISKENLGGRSQTQVRCLDWDERVEELARMLGGDAETGREHARRIMQR
jgi:DNA repair protein RecN (Recombination protein N)